MDRAFVRVASLMALAAGAVLFAPPLRAAEETDALWHWSTPVEGHRKGARGYLWIPPKSEQVRGIILSGMTLAELDLSQDPRVRAVAAEEDLAIVFMYPAIDAVFHYWERDSGELLVKMLADLAELSGYDELEHAPWITAGHSTGGIFCRNVAYWKPERTIAVIHYKSGNLPHHKPEGADLGGVPLLAINGQLEEFGPEGGIQPDLYRETQWHVIREQLLELRDAGKLINLLVEPGAGHFAWSDRVGEYAALYIQKAVQHRLPQSDGPYKKPPQLTKIDPNDGWLTDSKLAEPEHEAAAYPDYGGIRAKRSGTSTRNWRRRLWPSTPRCVRSWKSSL